MVHFLAILIVPLFMAVSTAQADVCYSHKIVPALASKKAEELFSAVKAKHEMGAQANMRADQLALFTARKKLASYNFAFEADVNNDGKKEVIFSITGSGAGRGVELYVFAKEKNQYVFLGEPPKPAGASDGWFTKIHRNKNTKQNEFLSNECGVIHLNFENSGTHEKFLWKNGQTVAVPVK